MPKKSRHEPLPIYILQQHIFTGWYRLVGCHAEEWRGRGMGVLYSLTKYHLHDWHEGCSNKFVLSVNLDSRRLLRKNEVKVGETNLLLTGTSVYSFLLNSMFTSFLTKFHHGTYFLQCSLHM